MMKDETDLQHLARQWGASGVPFAPMGDKDWLDTPAAQKISGHLHQTAALRSVMLLSGPNGVGKSALAARWMRSLDPRIFHPLALTQATLSGSGILGSVATKLGKPASFRRERNLQLIEQALAELERRILVIILDEAQNYAPSTLEEVRLLLGLNLPEAPAFALVLLGDDYLLSSLKLRSQRALFSRLACQCTLAPWNGAQCAQYLGGALQAAGLSTQVLEPAAGELLSAASGGLPRSLNLLARAAWINAATQGAQKISAADVQPALESVPCVPGLQGAPPAPNPQP
jgi:type II secretory pathway predicted ATPase ExeA